LSFLRLLPKKVLTASHCRIRQHKHVKRWEEENELGKGGRRSVQ